MAAVSPEHPDPRMTVSRVELAVAASDMAIRLDCKSQVWIQAGAMLWRMRRMRRSVGGLAPRAVPAPGVAAGAALEVVRRGEDEKRPVEVVVLGREFGATGRGFLRGRFCCGG